MPGIGSLVLVGIINRDYPVLLAAALVVTIAVLTANLLVDLIGSVLDPRQVRGRSGDEPAAARRTPRRCSPGAARLLLGRLHGR